MNDQQTITAQRRAIAALTAEVEQLRANASEPSKVDDALPACKQALDDAIARIDELTTANTGLTEEVATLTAEVTELKAEIETLRRLATEEPQDENPPA